MQGCGGRATDSRRKEAARPHLRRHRSWAEARMVLAFGVQAWERRMGVSCWPTSVQLERGPQSTQLVPLGT